MKTESNKIINQDGMLNINSHGNASRLLFEEFMAHEIAEIKRTGLLPSYVKVEKLTDSINLHSHGLTENVTF